MNTTLPRSFWIIGIAGLIWNILGVINFLSTTFMPQSVLDMLPEGQRALINSTPSWILVMFGIATIGGALACVGLLMKKSWSTLLFAISLIAVLVQMSYSWLMTNAVEVYSPVQAYVIPALVIVIAAFLWYYAKRAQSNGWIT